MIIPNTLSQFKEKNFLLLVSGKQNLILYEGRDGMIERKCEIFIPNPHYSDNEGFFMTRSGAGAMRSGSVKKDVEDKVVEDFLRAVEREMKKREARDYETVYLTAPSTIKNKIINAIPAQFKEKIENHVAGNFCAESPIKILEKFKPNPDDVIVPIRTEAKKILDKSIKARNVVGNMTQL